MARSKQNASKIMHSLKIAASTKGLLREAIVKKSVILYNNFTNKGWGSTGFHIAYSEIVNDPK